MAPYLLRSSMAIRKSANEIEYLDNAAWAERLDQGFQRTLAANLATLLPSDRVYLSAWEQDQVRLRVVVNVERFDVNLQGLGTLIADWLVLAPDSEKPLMSGQARLIRTGAVPRGNPEAIATTLSALVGEFSQELAQILRHVSAGKVSGSEHSPATSGVLEPNLKWEPGVTANVCIVQI